MYAHAHIHCSPQATPPIDIEGCGLRDQRCCDVHPASFNQLAKETRYSRGSFARNSSRHSLAGQASEGGKERLGTNATIPWMNGM